ncbi:hypothetical protein OAO18_03865 [Francisellaceae bacterium]|nr:hypothetical protein [Francisellaceae bacterium]
MKKILLILSLVSSAAFASSGGISIQNLSKSDIINPSITIDYVNNSFDKSYSLNETIKGYIQPDISNEERNAALPSSTMPINFDVTEAGLPESENKSTFKTFTLSFKANNNIHQLKLKGHGSADLAAKPYFSQNNSNIGFVSNGQVVNYIILGPTQEGEFRVMEQAWYPNDPTIKFSSPEILTTTSLNNK